jgi:hypothetical protein
MKAHIAGALTQPYHDANWHPAENFRQSLTVAAERRAQQYRS